MRSATVVVVLALIGLATAVALRYGAGRLDGAVASAIERHGTALTGTGVTVDGVDLALNAGRVEVGGLTVENPRGYDTDYAVRVGSAAVDLDIGSLASAVPVVEELVLDGALINAEQRGAASNLTDIERHATAASRQAPAGEPGRIVVQRFRVRNARVLITSEHLSAPEELPLRDLLVENIGSATGGATYSEAAEAMLLPILAAARSAAAERIRSAARDAVSEAAREELSERVEQLLDRE